jgi:hypothetical protein
LDNNTDDDDEEHEEEEEEEEPTSSRILHSFTTTTASTPTTPITITTTRILVLVTSSSRRRKREQQQVVVTNLQKRSLLSFNDDNIVVVANNQKDKKNHASLWQVCYPPLRMRIVSDQFCGVVTKQGSQETKTAGYGTSNIVTTLMVRDPSCQWRMGGGWRQMTPTGVTKWKQKPEQIGGNDDMASLLVALPLRAW